MKHPIPGRFYTIFEDETIDEALSCHSRGFESIEDAIEEANLETEPVKFKVLNSELKIVHRGTTAGLNGGLNDTQN